MSRPHFPQHIRRQYGSSRAFKAQKRRDLQALRRALDDFSVGCTYVPGGSEQMDVMRKTWCILYNNMREKKWGRS